MGLGWHPAHHSRGSPLAKAAMSAAVPRPRLSAWPGGAGSQKRFGPYKTINAPVAPGSQSFLSNVPAFLRKKSDLRKASNRARIQGTFLRSSARIYERDTKTVTGRLAGEWPLKSKSRLTAQTPNAAPVPKRKVGAAHP